MAVHQENIDCSLQPIRCFVSELLLIQHCNIKTLKWVSHKYGMTGRISKNISVSKAMLAWLAQYFHRLIKQHVRPCIGREFLPFCSGDEILNSLLTSLCSRPVQYHFKNIAPAQDADCDIVSINNGNAGNPVVEKNGDCFSRRCIG